MNHFISIASTILAFGIIGGGLKFIDDAFDEGIFNKKLASITAVILVILWIFLSLKDPYSGTILFSILAGVLFSGKIDNTVFIASTLALALTTLIMGATIFWIPLIILTIFGVIDELGNDYTDIHKTRRLIKFFFEHRCTLKLGILAICLTTFFPIEYFLIFLAFDISYDFVGMYSKRISNIAEPKVTIFLCNELPFQIPVERVCFMKSGLRLEDKSIRIIV